MQVFLLPGGTGCLLCHLFRQHRRFLIGNPGAAHQQTVGIHAIGGAGDQRTQILTGDNPQQTGVVRQHSMDFHHLIGKALLQHMQIKDIPGCQLLQIGKHLLACHTAVPGENAMGAFSTDWKRTAQKMSDAPLQRGIFRPVVDGKIHTDFGDLHIAHDAIASQIELTGIVPGCGL